VGSKKEGIVRKVAGLTPFRELDAIERRARHVLEGIGFVSALLPAADVYETANEFVVELEVPGFDENELSIEISDQSLRVSGERAQTKGEVEKTFRSHGRLEHRFERSFQLPANADTEHVRAVFDKGVLEVRAPKRQPGEARTVQISKPARAAREA
jgi:HSP20 family protein